MKKGSLTDDLGKSSADDIRRPIRLAVSFAMSSADDMDVVPDDLDKSVNLAVSIAMSSRSTCISH